MEVSVPKGVQDINTLALTIEEIRPCDVRMHVPFRFISWMEFSVDNDVAQILPHLNDTDDVLASMTYNWLNLGAVQKSLADFVLPLLHRLHIRLGPRENQWLTQLAIQKLHTLPFRTLLVLLTVFIPQIQSADNAKELKVTQRAFFCCPPDNPTQTICITARPRSIGPGEMREFVFQLEPWRYLSLFITDQSIPNDSSWKAIIATQAAYPHRFQIGLNAGDVVYMQYVVQKVQYGALFLVTSHSPKGGKDTDIFRYARTQYFVATWIPQPESYTSNIHKSAVTDLPPKMQNLSDDQDIQLQTLRLIGKTAPAAQLFAIAHMLPALQPIALGTQLRETQSCPPLLHESELLRSLTQLTRMLATGHFITYLPNAPAIAKLIYQEATTDHGHFVSLALALCLAIRTRRCFLTVGGIFGAGKTTSMALLTVWIILSTVNTKILLSHRENPAGAAMAGMIERLPLTPAQRALFMRPVAENKMPHQTEAEKANSITGETRHIAWQAAERARVVIATASTIMGNSLGYKTPLIAFAKSCNLAALDEGQQVGTPETAYVQSIVPHGALHIIMGDKNQVMVV